MKKISLLTLACLSILFSFNSCKSKKAKQEEMIIKATKPLGDEQGNHYSTGTIVVNKNDPPPPTGVTFDKVIMMEDLRTEAKPDGTPTKDGAGLLVVGCYKDMRVNCDTLGAIYSAQQAIGQTIAQLVATSATNGDADGDGFNDASVKAALIAAGYNPDVYSISALFDPEVGSNGQTANDTIPVAGYKTPSGDILVGSTNKNLTYVINKTTGDTIYTKGVGVNPVTGEPKILVPDISKINFKTIVQQPVKPIRGSCPENWHIPTDGELKQLEMALGMSGVDVNKEGVENDRGKNEKLGPKLAAQLNLKYSGYWSENGTYAQLGEVEAFWTCSGGKDKWGKDYVWIRYIDTLAHKGIIRKRQYDKSAFSVRCFKD